MSFSKVQTQNPHTFHIAWHIESTNEGKINQNLTGGRRQEIDNKSKLLEKDIINVYTTSLL